MLSKTACRGRVCALVFLLFVSGGLFAQTVITGRVINSTDKQPIAGATIQVRDSRLATQSSPDGTFSLQSNKAISTLVITVVGFNPETVDVSGRTALGDIGLRYLNHFFKRRRGYRLHIAEKERPYRSSFRCKCCEYEQGSDRFHFESITRPGAWCGCARYGPARRRTAGANSGYQSFRKQ